jgi:hypothetical protein
LTDHYNGMNTSTTATDRNQTIDWRTLKSCSLVLTPQSIIEEELRAPGCELNALPAALYLNAVVANISSTHTLSALANATSKALDSHPVADGETMTPAWEPIIVAMKPLDGTFAHNAEAHGVAGLHIDAGRIDGVPRTTHKGGNIIGDRNGASGYSVGDQGYEYSGAAGRWPANVILDLSLIHI